MTLCIAALADDRKALVMAADRMISLPFIESELDVSKILPIAENWWVMIAANNLPNIFPVVDRIINSWQPQTSDSIESVVEIVTTSYREEWRTHAEVEWLLPHGFDWQTFLAYGKIWLPEYTFRQIDDGLSKYNLGVTLMVCGFDKAEKGHIFTVENPGVASRKDIPGFHAIGSGFYGAEYMMYYRELGYSFPVAEWLYYIYEAKAFGEMAGAVGWETELLVARPGKHLEKLDNDGFNKTLDRIWMKRAPGQLDGNDKRALRNLLKLSPASQSETNSNGQ